MEDGDIEDIFDGDFTQALMNELSAYGQVVLMYFAQNKMWVTFRDGRSALQALCVDEKPVSLYFPTGNGVYWLELINDDTVTT